EDRTGVDRFHSRQQVLASRHRVADNTPILCQSPGLEARGSPMKYGMNLLLWTTHVTPEIYPTIAKIKKTGFDGVEVPVFEGELSHYKEVAKELKNQGIACSSTVTVATEAANPISPDAALREAGLER